MALTGWGFGLGTLGRDMVSALVSLYLMFYLTEVAHISGAELGAITVMLVAMRIFDAVNDPFMGLIVDNTRSRWGKFKPWIGWGALGWGAATLLLFTDFGIRGWGYVALLTICYLLFEIFYTINDISYWSMLPSLTQDQKQRERIGVLTRISANVGLFSAVVALVPATEALTKALGSAQLAWFTLAAILVSLMLAFQALTLLLAREQVPTTRVATPLRELLGTILHNDQLLWVGLAMVAYMAGYVTTTSFGLHYFKYIFGDEDAYPFFAAILGTSIIASLAVFPLVSRRLRRSTIHVIATALSVVGYAVFLVSGTNINVVAIAGLLLFTGQGAIQLLMTMFVADCVEYGQWKLGRRNESVTFSVQPFIYKFSNAVASGLIGATLIASGIDTAAGPQDVSHEGVVLVQVTMFLVPMVLMMVSFLILRLRYTLDEDRYARIINELAERNEDATRQAD